MTESLSTPPALLDIHPIVHRERIIGTVEMHYTDRIFKERMGRAFWSKCLALVSLTFILSLAIFIVLRRSVIMPLRHLEKFALAIGENEKSAAPMEGNRYAVEIDNVRTAMIDMLGRLRSRFADLSKSQEALRESEQRLQQAQKMEAIGRLAGGIAHDFNNILQAIIGYTEILLMNEPDSAKGYHLQQILQGGKRARDLTKQILTFSRQSQVEKQAFDLATILGEVLKLLRASIPATIEIRRKIPADCGRIMADPSQFHQVLMNLCTNACHAMDKERGTLSISVDIVHALPEGLVEKNAGADCSFIRLAVADTGHGIDPTIRDRIFEPFFTTKPKGEGTGMGLSVVYGIVKDMGGVIDVASEVGSGSTFTLYLPRLNGTLHLSEEPAKEPVAKGTGRILVVDDEEIITEMLTIMLENMGYTVTAYSDSLAAFETFRQNPTSFDLVMTDYAMPGITGLELTDKIRAIRPDIAVVLCTGFSTRVNSEIVKARGISAFVYKPFEQRHLAGIIRNLLAGVKELQ